MTYVLLGALLVLLAAQRWDHGRQSKAERAHHSQQQQGTLEHVRELTNQIVLLKVEPQQAAAYAAPAPEPSPEDELNSMLGDDSLAADAAWAEMVERNRS